MRRARGRKLIAMGTSLRVGWAVIVPEVDGAAKKRPSLSWRRWPYYRIYKGKGGTAEAWDIMLPTSKINPKRSARIARRIGWQCERYGKGIGNGRRMDGMYGVVQRYIVRLMWPLMAWGRCYMVSTRSCSPALEVRSEQKPSPMQYRYSWNII